MTKNNCNQYQYVIRFLFIYKVLKDPTIQYNNREPRK